MASRVVAIASGQVGLQLGLTGVTVEEITDVREAEKRIVEYMDDRKVQVLILDEAFRGQFTEWFEARFAKHSGEPLIMFCPRFEEEDANTDAYINSILRPAVGFEIRLGD